MVVSELLVIAFLDSLIKVFWLLTAVALVLIDSDVTPVFDIFVFKRALLTI